MGIARGPKIVTSGLVLALDAADKLSYPVNGYYFNRTWSSGWAGSFSNPTYSFDGNLSTGTIQNGTATYTFAGGGLSVSGTVRIYVTFGASSGQVSGLPNVIVVDGTDVSSKMAAANVYTTGVGAGWIDITSEVGSVFNTIVMTGTSNRSNPSIYAVEVNGQILIDNLVPTSWRDLSGNNNTGTLTNGPTFNSNNGGNIIFDGTNDYVISTVTGGLGSGDFTLEFWFYKNTDAGYVFNSRSGGTGSDGIDISRTLHITTASTVIFSATSVSNSTWMHIFIGRSGTTMYRYINLTLNGSATMSNSFTGTTFYIGGSIAGNVGYLNGYMPIVKLYNRFLSSDERSTNYNAVKSRFGL